MCDPPARFYEFYIEQQKDTTSIVVANVCTLKEGFHSCKRRIQPGKVIMLRYFLAALVSVPPHKTAVWRSATGSKMFHIVPDDAVLSDVDCFLTCRWIFGPDHIVPLSTEKALPSAALLRIRSCQARSSSSLLLHAFDLAVMPEPVWELTHLTILNVSMNHLVALPPALGLLVALQVLDISDNLIEYIPHQIGNLSRLETLLLARNKLRTLPQELASLKSLRTLDLEGNPLDGNRFSALLPAQMHETGAKSDVDLSGLLSVVGTYGVPPIWDRSTSYLFPIALRAVCCTMLSLRLFDSHTLTAVLQYVAADLKPVDLHLVTLQCPRTEDASLFLTFDRRYLHVPPRAPVPEQAVASGSHAGPLVA